MSVKVEMPKTQEVMQSVLPYKVKLAIMNAFYRYYYRYIPHADGSVSGELADNVNITDEFIEHLAIYAHYQYVGEGYSSKRQAYTGVKFKYTTTFNELATAYWDKAMLTAEGKRFFAEVQRIIERGG